MSDTPRTDEEAWTPKKGAFPVVDAEFARELERDLAGLFAAATQYMATCPADYDTTAAFRRATDKLKAAIAKAEGK